MIANHLRRLRWAITFALMLPACQCEVTTEAQPPTRPRGGPAAAIWAGGVDGGNFILMSPAAADGTYSVKISHDYTGELDFNGRLRLNQPSTKPIDVRDPNTYSDWIGNTLTLRDGRTLSPIKKG